MHPLPVRLARFAGERRNVIGLAASSETLQPEPGDLLGESMYRELFASANQQRALTYAGCLLKAAVERSGP